MRISVLITTYNRAHLVGEAIDSVLAQTRPADEIVLIDDGSTDGTPARLAAYGDRITVVRKENGGISSARNAGLRRATGDWVTFLDDDDVWYPNRLEVLDRDLRAADPDIQVHVANMRYVGTGYVYDEMDLYGIEAPRGAARRIEDIFASAARGFHMNSLACARELALAIGFDESLFTHEDKLFSGRLGHGRPWLVTGDLVSDVRRIEGDTKALTELSTRNAERRLANMLSVNDRFLALGVTGRNRRALLGTRHFLLLKQAVLLMDTGRGGTGRARLLEAARCHPSKAKGWLKILPFLLLGRRGFRFLRIQKFER